MARKIKILPAEPSQPTIKSTLFSHLGTSAFNQVSTKGMGGKSHVPLSGLLHVCAYLYETGAVLGRARPDKLSELLSMSFPADVQYCLEEVKYLLRRRLETSGRYAHSFYTFYLYGTMRDMNISFDIEGMKETHIDIRNKAEFSYFLEYAGAEGLLLGGQFPDLVEMMYGHRYGDQSDIILEMSRGINIHPEEKTGMPIQEREQLILKRLSKFVSQYQHDYSGGLDISSNAMCSKYGISQAQQGKSTEAYLDIETTGLDPGDCYITVVGIHVVDEFDSRFTQLIGKDVTPGNILEALSGVNVIYTYNGSRFDLPFIYSCLGINLVTLYKHHDLMYDCWQNNLYGGFKSVERQLGIKRRLKEINGYQAVRLWWRYLNDYDEEALNILLEYNKEDVINLRMLKEKLL